MVDLTQDADEYFAELAMVEKILIEGKTKAQIAEVIALLKAVVDSPQGAAHDAARARLFERLEQLHHENQASRISA